MNEAKTAVLMDSGSDLTPEVIERYGIYVVRLKIMYQDKTGDDGIDFTPDYVYDHFKEEIPKTSTPNLFEITEIVKQIRNDGYENIIACTISSKLSGTYSAIKNVLDSAEGMKTYAFDSRNISIGSGILAVYAASRLEEGASFDEVVRELEEKRYDSHIGYYMDTLDYLKAGGRITPSVALVGKILNLKPIISCNTEGVYHTIARIRGRKQGVKRLVDYMLPEGIDVSKCWICILNGRGSEYAEQAKVRIRERYPDVKFFLEEQITASMAIHTGPGLLGIGVFALDPAAYMNESQVQMEKAKEAITDAADTIKTKTAEASEQLQEKLPEWKEQASEAAGKLSESVSEVSAKFQEKLPEWKEQASEAYTEAKEKISEAAEKLNEKYTKKDE